MSKEGHDVSHIINMRQRNENDFIWYKESRVSVTAEGLTLEHIDDRILEFGSFWIHRIDGHDDVVEIKWKEKMNNPTKEDQ